MNLVRLYSSKITREFYPNSTVKIYRNSKNVLRATATPPSHTLPKETIVNGGQVVSETQFEKNTSERLAAVAESPSEYVENAVKIQMLSRNLHRQIFGEEPPMPPVDAARARNYVADLKRHGIDIESTERLSDVNLKLPPLRGKNIEEHFYSIAKEQVMPYEELLSSLVECTTRPPRPAHWLYQTGWTMYDSNKKSATAIEYPYENALVLDVEVCVADGGAPILATAVSRKHWYSWVSPRLMEPTEQLALPRQQITARRYTLDDLMPLGKHSPKLVVGHNVSYDRARIREQYLMEDTGTRFIDTMSLHVCVSGITSYQRALLKSKKEPTPEDEEWLGRSALNSLVEVQRLYCSNDIPISKEPRNIFVEGSLTDVRANFQSLVNYCAGDVEATHNVLRALYPLFKKRFPHPVTLAGMLEIGSAYLPVNSNWLRYINEADLTYEDLSIEAKYHLSRRADEACALLNDEKYRQHLWLWDQDWSVQELKMKKSKTAQTNASNSISADSSVAAHTHNALGLSEEELRLTLKFQHLYESQRTLPARRPLLPGYPAWYRKLCNKPPKTMQAHTDWVPGPTELSTGMQIAPKLLCLCWEGYPLHYIREHGWGFLVPFSSVSPATLKSGGKVCTIPIAQLTQRCPVPKFARDRCATAAESEFAMGALHRELDVHLGKQEFYTKVKKDRTAGLYQGTGVWCNQVVDDCCFFIKLPHKNGNSFRVGNPLSKDFLNKFSANVLSSADAESGPAARVVEIARMMSYWRNNRDRIIGQMVVWLPAESLPAPVRASLEVDSPLEYGAICPQIVVCGTLTRRAMEPTWLTASNSQHERIGSELRAMVQAPLSYKFVGADVDSQELWIASVLGDAYACRMHGATPLGWMTLSGSKSRGTDMHSITAKAVGISRDHAKVINYARIYGAGQTFAEGLLKQFNPTFSTSEARTKAMKMYAFTKGKRIYRVRDEFKDQYGDSEFSTYDARKIALTANKTIDEVFHRPRWIGGTESAMFNRLEEIALSDKPLTPFLNCRLSRALESDRGTENRFLPTRVNWVVQSGAVDFLHLMLVSMRWLIGPHARFCLSFHDEVRYLVKEDMAYKAALAMHITNLLTRAFCTSRIGLTDLPMSVAFFSSVEVDTVLRKESTMDCKTPSNQHGLKIGYGIPPGENLSVYDAIVKAGGNDLTKWQWVK